MKALIALLVVGMSSVALAQPAQVAPTYPQYDQRDHRYDDHDDRDNRFDDRDDRFDDRDHRFDDRDDRFDDRDHRDNRFDRRMWMRRPVLLASNVSMMRQWNRDHRPMLVDIDQRVGGLKTIKLERNHGRMYVDSIVINYADGHQQTVRANQMLSARQPSLLIQLEHGAVTGMYVYGSTTRGRATFDVIGLRR